MIVFSYRMNGSTKKVLVMRVRDFLQKSAGKQRMERSTRRLFGERPHLRRFVGLARPYYGGERSDYVYI